MPNLRPGIRCKLLCRGRSLPPLLFLVVLVICLPSLVGTIHQAHAASLPDLTVSSISLEEASNPGQPVQQVAPGDQFLIVAFIKNLGNATAFGYYIDAYYDSNYGRAGPDETQVWYVGNFTAVAGTHTTKWVVDPDNQIAESNETNNELDYTFTIQAQVSITVAANPSGWIVVESEAHSRELCCP